MQAELIVILGMGGTIAGRSIDASDNIAYTAAQVTIESLVASIPGLGAAGQVLAEQVEQIDSKDMTFAAWRKLAQRVDYFLARDEVQGVVDHRKILCSRAS